jgi:hypothetical protein
VTECDYRRGLDWQSDLLNSLMQHVTRLCSSLLQTHTYQCPVTPSLPFLGSGFQRGTFPFLWVSELSSASATSFNSNSSRLKTSSPLDTSRLHSTSYIASASKAQKTPFLLQCNCCLAMAWRIPVLRAQPSARTTQKRPFLCCSLQAAA